MAVDRAQMHAAAHFKNSHTLVDHHSTPFEPHHHTATSCFHPINSPLVTSHTSSTILRHTKCLPALSTWTLAALLVLPFRPDPEYECLTCGKLDTNLTTATSPHSRRTGVRDGNEGSGLWERGNGYKRRWNHTISAAIPTKIETFTMSMPPRTDRVNKKAYETTTIGEVTLHNSACILSYNEDNRLTIAVYNTFGPYHNPHLVPAMPDAPGDDPNDPAEPVFPIINLPPANANNRLWSTVPRAKDALVAPNSPRNLFQLVSKSLEEWLIWAEFMGYP
ncbi:hypothetical protein BJ508DRAFT_336186 [Ascobolus immersus RN42]|uniref:Uncharacterized protein n=1 Tax=Ascobolus immersus RN42 TaxID=1160509 RepID=A0A3N4H9I0_ASCIM|nr:hypothetical protein BJ508DRAFT_336186 [Ascobolus immersus RN42]